MSTPGHTQKIAVFSRALSALEERHRPDLILVGCNTLSVLTAETPFVKKTKVPVLDIVEPGVDLIARGLAQDGRSAALIFG